MGWFAEDWAAPADDGQAVLGDARQRVWIIPGRTGRGLDRSRLVFE